MGQKTKDPYALPTGDDIQMTDSGLSESDHVPDAPVAIDDCETDHERDDSEVVDEFHESLDMDSAAMMDMNDKERDEYLRDLVRRRDEAHWRDIFGDDQGD